MPDIDYQHKRSNPYWLEPPRYAQALAYVRQYPRLCMLRDAALHGSPTRDDASGAPKGVKSDPTAIRGINLARIDEQLSVIDKSIQIIPKDVRQAVLDNVIYKVPAWHVAGKYHCGEATVKRWRARFLWEIVNRADIP